MSHFVPHTVSAVHRRPLVTAATVLFLVSAMLLGSGCAPQEPAPPSAVPSSASGESGSGDGAADTGEKRAEPLPASPPRQVSIPSLNVSSSLESLGLDAKGAMETPRDPAKAGWFTEGPTPGAEGPAVIAGHVTWNEEPSVFFRLAKLKRGQTIEVTRKDGKTAEFTVDKVAQYPKSDFPTVEVYRNLDHAGLRLITCGGQYSKSERYYTDNVVVYASLSGTSSV